MNNIQSLDVVKSSILFLEHISTLQRKILAFALSFFASLATFFCCQSYLCSKKIKYEKQDSSEEALSFERTFAQAQTRSSPENKQPIAVEKIKKISLKKLPKDILVNITTLLKWNDLENLSGVDKSIYQLVNDDLMHHHLLAKILLEKNQVPLSKRLEISEFAGKSLRTLDLTDSLLSDQDLIALFQKCPNIQEIHLTRCNNLTFNIIPFFPKKLVSLNLSECALLTTITGDQLKQLPRKLQRLNLSFSGVLFDDPIIEYLPEKLNELSCDQLTTQALEKLSSFSLHRLEISCYQLRVEDIAKIPRSVRSLGLTNCKNLTNAVIPQLDKFLSSFQITGSRLTNLDDLPKTLTRLEIIHDNDSQERLLRISHFPPNLIYLKISCFTLLEIDSFPNNLKHLDLSDCTVLNKIPPFPQSLISLNLNNCCELIINIKELPPKLETLRLFSVKLTSPVVDNLPKFLLFLELANCEITKIVQFPKKLVTIDLGYCIYLTIDLNDLPDTTRVLILSSVNISNKVIENLPENLRIFELAECTTIKKIKSLPFRLYSLNLYGCINLEEIQGVSKRLKKFDLTGCEQLKNIDKLYSEFRTTMWMNDETGTLER